MRREGGGGARRGELTELHSIQRSHVATHRLHGEHGNLVSDISVAYPRTDQRPARPGASDRFQGGETYPETTFASRQ